MDILGVKMGKFGGKKGTFGEIWVKKGKFGENWSKKGKNWGYLG